MVKFVQRLIQPLIMVDDRLRTVDIERRAEPLCGFVERIGFAAEFPALVMK
jgi:hypothetical protein